MKGFIDFVREQGVVGLAVGSPLLALGMRNLSSLQDAYLQIGSAKILWGDFLNDLINFLVMAFIVYFGVKILKLDTLDKKKDT
ncbi:MAG: MscL family protein [Patescibacteria group bacterium]